MGHIMSSSKSTFLQIWQFYFKKKLSPSDILVLEFVLFKRVFQGKCNLSFQQSVDKISCVIDQSYRLSEREDTLDRRDSSKSPSVKWIQSCKMITKSYLLVTDGAQSCGLIILFTIDISRVVKLPLSQMGSPPLLILEVPIEACEGSMLLTLVLQEQGALFNSKLLQVPEITTNYIPVDANCIMGCVVKYSSLSLLKAPVIICNKGGEKPWLNHPWGRLFKVRYTIRKTGKWNLIKLKSRQVKSLRLKEIFLLHRQFSAVPMPCLVLVWTFAWCFICSCTEVVERFFLPRPNDSPDALIVRGLIILAGCLACPNLPWLHWLTACQWFFPHSNHKK